LDFDPDRTAGTPSATSRFFLYVEGPRDRDILQAWTYRLMPAKRRRLFEDSIILGGRRPARAVEHFRGAEPGARGLCILDRDDGSGELPSEPGIEFFTWGRRHIESYLLVPAALHRVLSRDKPTGRLERALRDHLPREGDETAWREMDAKRLLAPNGELSRALGRRLPLSRIARATREAELHPDVHDLFARLRGGLGVRPQPTVIR